MNIGEVPIWESSNLFPLTPSLIGLVMLLRWYPRKGGVQTG
jgi:hypothetical protein